MHLVYIATIDRADVDWTSSIPRDWIDLDTKARDFNLKILDTWAENPALLEEWVATLSRMVDEKRHRRTGRKPPPTTSG